MTEAEQLYTATGQAIAGAEQSQMFGKPCFKLNGKAFICFFKECMVFKLNGETHKAALSLDGAELFDPSGKQRPMKEWVQVPYAYKKEWKSYALAAADHLNGK